MPPDENRKGRGEERKIRGGKKRQVWKNIP